jgi:hypothetical protein
MLMVGFFAQYVPNFLALSTNTSVSMIASSLRICDRDRATHSTRHRVLKQGARAFSDGGGTDCTVRNLSESGARTEIASLVSLPQSFTLVIPAGHFRRHCHPVWSADRRIGVAFD